MTPHAAYIIGMVVLAIIAVIGGVALFMRHNDAYEQMMRESEARVRVRDRR